MTTEVARTPTGQFPAGVSGNPSGRPKGTKNQITELKQNLELAVRKNVKAQDVQDIVQKLVDKAKEGDTKAAKLILDKVLPNATSDEEDTGDRGGITIRIENATFAALAQKKPAAIDVEVVEET